MSLADLDTEEATAPRPAPDDERTVELPAPPLLAPNWTLWMALALGLTVTALLASAQLAR